MKKEKCCEAVDESIFNTQSVPLYIKREKVKFYFYKYTCPKCGASYALTELAYNLVKKEDKTELTFEELDALIEKDSNHLRINNAIADYIKEHYVKYSEVTLKQFCEDRHLDFTKLKSFMDHSVFKLSKHSMKKLIKILKPIKHIEDFWLKNYMEEKRLLVFRLWQIATNTRKG